MSLNHDGLWVEYLPAVETMDQHKVVNFPPGGRIPTGAAL